MTSSMPVVGGERKPRRYRPTHEELISEHLKPKILGEYRGDEEVIGEVDFGNFEPWDLPGLSKVNWDDQVWYYFSRRNFIKNCVKFKRTTKAGSWNLTGRNLPIKDSLTKATIGIKRTFVFYEKASPKKVRTGWTYYEYEYTPEAKLTNQGDFVLIKLLKRDITLKRKDKEKVQIDDPTLCMDSVVETQIPCGVENQDTYCEGEPSSRMSSNFQDQSQASQYMASSDFEGCYLNELIPNYAPTGVQISNCLDSGFEYQNPNKLAAMTTDDSCQKASDFENQNPVALPDMATGAFAFESQNYTSEFGGELISSMETSPEFRNQTESSLLMASTFKYQDKEAYIPASGEDRLDFGKQNPYTESNMSTYDQIDWHSSMASLPQGYIPKGMAISPELNPELQAEFTGDGTDLFSSFENLSPLDNSEMCCPRASDSKNQSTQNDGESSSLVPTDFENQNTDKNTNLSVSQEGQRCPLTPTLSDFDFSVEAENCWSPPFAFLSGHDLENYVAQQENLSPEEQSQLLEELKAFLELKNCLNSSEVLLPTNTEVMPSYNGIEPFVST